MTSYYGISDNTFDKDGMPWIQSIVDGLVDIGRCLVCQRGQSKLGDLKVLMQDERAKYWPDVLGCGAYPCFVVSQRFVDSMRKDGIRLVLGGGVKILEPVENELSLKDAPPYYWVDGKRHRAAKMDFEASGYVDARFCRECGAFSSDISATNSRQHADPPPPITFHYDEGSGYDLFTTDMSWAYFLCTERVLRCASLNKLTNIEFTRVEDGRHGKSITY